MRLGIPANAGAACGEGIGNLMRIPSGDSDYMLMTHLRKVVALPNLAGLEDRIDRARQVLQRTTETDPAFEDRITRLIDLVRRRDRALDSSPEPPFPPAA